MRKLFLFLFIALFMSQAALALTFDTVWIHYNSPNQCQFACFSVDTTKIIAAMDYTIYYLDLITGNKIDSMEKATDVISDGSISMSTNASRIASVLANGKCVVWDSSSKTIIKTFEFDTINKINNVSACALSPDGRYIVCGTSHTFPGNYGPLFGTNILIYDLNANTIVKWMDSSFSPVSDQIHCMTFSPDGNHFLISTKGNLTKYSVNGWQIEKVLEANTDTTYGYLSYSRDGKYLCGATTQYSNTVWDMDADTLYKTFTKEKLGNYYGIINFSPDNQYLLFGGGGLFRDSNRTQIWDFINDTSIYYSGIHSASGIDYSINGKYLLLADHTKLFLLTPNKSITGINELPNEYLNALYPNPAGDFLNINSANIIGKNIDIFDMLGNKLMSVVAESTETRINIGTLPTGVYMIKNSELTKLFLKK